MLMRKTPSQQKKQADRLLKKVDALKDIQDKDVDYEEPAEDAPVERRKKNATKPPKHTVESDVDLESVLGIEEEETDPLLSPPPKKNGRPRKDPDETAKQKLKRERAERRAAKAAAEGLSEEDLELSPKSRALVAQAEDVITSDVVIFDAPTGGKISKLGARAKRTIIGGSAEQIHQLIEHGNTDAATTLIYKKLLQSVVDTLPYMEMVIRKSKGTKGAYAYNSMVSSVRELMTDIQQTQDRGRQGEIMVERIIYPVFLEIVAIIMREFEGLGQKMRRDDKMQQDHVNTYLKEFDEVQQRIGGQFQTFLKEIRDELRKFLQR